MLLYVHALLLYTTSSIGGKKLLSPVSVITSKESKCIGLSSSRNGSNDDRRRLVEANTISALSAFSSIQSVHRLANPPKGRESLYAYCSMEVVDELMGEKRREGEKGRTEEVEEGGGEITLKF